MWCEGSRLPDRPQASQIRCHLFVQQTPTPPARCIICGTVTAMAESMPQFPRILSGEVTPQSLEWLAYTVAVRPGISTDEVARRTGLSRSDATRLRPQSCHIDSTGRWWPMKAVRALSEWCLVQPDPECMEPVDADWSLVRGVVDDDVWISVFTESFAWPPLRPNQHVLYKPHPLTVEGSGPWG